MSKTRPYLDNGFLELDNNTAERAMKPVVIGRKRTQIVKNSKTRKQPKVEVGRAKREHLTMTTSITKTPCKDLYEERAAITEFDGQLSRYLAELTAAKAQGFDNSIAISSAFFLDDKGNCNCPLCFQPTLPPTQRVQRAKTIQRFDKKASLDW